MNYLVFLNPRTGELEKILSGVKCMLVKEFDPVNPFKHPVEPGDNLYFLRDNSEYSVQVKATVTRVYSFTNDPDSDLSQILKERQPRLQLTEDQYNHWSAKKQVLLIEFDGAQKIDAIHAAPEKVAGQPDWVAFEEFNLIA
jgi:hypothetical protein